MPICVFDVAADGTASVPTDTAPTGAAQYRWWHFDRTDPDLAVWAKAHLSAIPAEALLAPETRPRCDLHDDGVILNLRGVNLNEGPADQMVAVRMWVAQGIVITVRVRRVFAIDDIRRRAVAGEPLPTAPMGLVAELARGLMTRIQSTVFDAAARTDDIEEAMEQDEQSLPADLPTERRKAIRLRRYLGPQRDALQRLAALDSPLVSKPIRPRLREDANVATLVYEELDALVGRLAAVADHHGARAAAEQSHNGYVLSIVAAVFLPLGFLTGLFGVNVGGMPGLNSPWAFTLLCAGLVVLTAVALWLLRRIRWI